MYWPCVFLSDRSQQNALRIRCSLLAEMQTVRCPWVTECNILPSTLNAAATTVLPNFSLVLTRRSGVRTRYTACSSQRPSINVPPPLAWETVTTSPERKWRNLELSGFSGKTDASCYFNESHHVTSNSALRWNNFTLLADTEETTNEAADAIKRSTSTKLLRSYFQKTFRPEAVLLLRTFQGSTSHTRPILRTSFCLRNSRTPHDHWNPWGMTDTLWAATPYGSAECSRFL
jgi:hypothetical protein